MDDGSPAPVNYARLRAAKAHNLVVTDSSYLSSRDGNRLYKRGYAVCGDLGVVQYELSRHGNLPYRFSKWIEKGGGGSALQVLLVSCEGGWNYIFGKLRCWQTMDHGVSVFDPNTIGSEMRSHDVHDCVVGSLLSPIALPFEHDLQ
jgi:hypothetical protein